MITTETIIIDGREFKRTVSDTYNIRKVGTDEVYSEAVDLPDATWAYEETDEPLPTAEVTLDDEADMRSALGVLGYVEG